MKYNILINSVLGVIFLLTINLKDTSPINDFQGKAYYMSKSTMSLGNFGARFSEAQKKQIMDRLKSRLEKKYVLTFNKQESMFFEEEKLRRGGCIQVFLSVLPVKPAYMHNRRTTKTF